jgi:hypothetical protein
MFCNNVYCEKLYSYISVVLFISDFVCLTVAVVKVRGGVQLRVKVSVCNYLSMYMSGILKVRRIALCSCTRQNERKTQRMQDLFLVALVIVLLMCTNCCFT